MLDDLKAGMSAPAPAPAPAPCDSDQASLDAALALAQQVTQASMALITGSSTAGACSCPAASTTTAAPSAAAQCAAKQSFAQLSRTMQTRWGHDEYVRSFAGLKDVLAGASLVPHPTLQHIQSIYRIEGMPGALAPEEGRLEFDTPVPVADLARALGGAYHSSTQQTVDEVVGGDGNTLRLNRLRFELADATVFVVCQLVPAAVPASGAGSG